MNCVGSTREEARGCAAVPSGPSASMEQLGGGGRRKASIAWPLLPAGVSSDSFHKMLSDLSYGQAMQNGQLPLSRNHLPLHLPLSQLSDRCATLRSSSGSWIHPVQGPLPTECYSWPCLLQTKDPLSHHITLNGGSLALDTAKGELVNASKMTPKEILEAKALAASKSHSEAERRRRERINTHLATLRALLPSSTKTDKASLLAEVIDQVKMLKRQVAEIHEYGPMPTDHNELNVERDSCSEGRLLIKASVCCDDRPDLMLDLTEALDALRLKTLRAELSTCGGRVKNVLIVTTKDGCGDQAKDLSIEQVQDALRLVMDVPGGEEISPNKRQRVTPFGSSAD